MTIEPPRPGEPRRPLGPRNPGDAWVVSDSGERYWGRFGAAGLVAWDPDRGVLLQHRVSWSHFGGTWGIPGGALHEGEAAVAGALREAEEEAGVPAASVSTLFTSVLDLGIWTYTTVVARVVEPFDAFVADPESNALEWVALDRVDELPLHPGFAATWPSLRSIISKLEVEGDPVVVVDGANVVGSVPDGWWKDRAGAAVRLLDRLDHIAARGVDARNFDWQTVLDHRTTWFPRFVLVVEGAARDGVRDRAAAGIDVILASGEGDDTIVDEVARLVDGGRSVVVVTSDRGLRQRLDDLGDGPRDGETMDGQGRRGHGRVSTVGARRLVDALDEAEATGL